MTDSELGWDEIFDPACSGYDSTLQFFGIAQLLATRSGVVVDVGCGRAGQVEPRTLYSLTKRQFQDLRGEGRKVIGIDIDPVGETNPILDEFRLIDHTGRWPLENNEVDLVFSNFTLEHVADPTHFVAELGRVLRPGGAFIARTISRYSVLATGARMVTNKHHIRVLRVLQPGRHQRDVFPTVYRMNTHRDLHGLFDPGFQWSVAHRGGLKDYFGRWPRLAKVIDAVEPRLPASMGTTLVLYARKRGSG